VRIRIGFRAGSVNLYRTLETADRVCRLVGSARPARGEAPPAGRRLRAWLLRASRRERRIRGTPLPLLPRHHRPARAEGEMTTNDSPPAPLAPYQSPPARDAAHALERGGVATGQGRVQEGARAEESDPARGVVHHERAGRHRPDRELHPCAREHLIFNLVGREQPIQAEKQERQGSEPQNDPLCCGESCFVRGQDREASEF